MKKRILITDVTTMGADRVCVAGIDKDGKSIRPVLPSGYITRSDLYDGNGGLIIAPRFLTEFFFLEKIRNPPHTEDHLFSPEKTRLVQKTSDAQMKRMLSLSCSGSVAELFDGGLVDKRYHKPDSGKRSLGTVRVRLSSIDLSHCRLSFFDEAGESYSRVKVNDLAFWRLAEYWGTPEGSAKKTLAKRLEKKLENVDEIFLRLGLARPWTNPNDGVEGCWLQVTGIYTFPDYLEGGNFADFPSPQMSTQMNAIDEPPAEGQEPEEGAGEYRQPPSKAASRPWDGRSPRDILRTYFGFEDFIGDQAEIVRHLISGRNAFVLLPTGSGKSICYQIPSMVRPGVGIVISPLIALMQDQVGALHEFGIRADFLNSSLTPEQARAVERRTISGELDMLYVAPERLLSPQFRHLLSRTHVGLFAIDEAHCVSQWGHDFRPEYLQIAEILENYPETPCVALTATADEVTREEILKKLNLEDARQFIASLDRPNIFYKVLPKSNVRSQLKEFLRARPPNESGIVYCRTRKKTEQIASWLSEEGYTALPYHAGLDRDVRSRHQRRFQQEDGIIIAATIAFGMGIDKPDVRFIAHLDLPKSLEAYYQETGRSGRDGENAVAWMVYSLGDVVAVRQMVADSTGDERFKRIQQRKLEALLGFCETAGCRRQVLLGYFGEHLPEPCGNCDTCLEKVETWDGTTTAQKVLSCVYDTGQRFGAAYLTDVLLGKSAERIRRFGHDNISTFGAGKELFANEWKSVFRQLVASGILSVDIDSKAGFHISSIGHSVMQGERKVLLRRDPTPPKMKRTHRPGAPDRGTPQGVPQGAPKDMSENVLVDQASVRLWEKLREFRMEIAAKKKVPAFVIFHDRTLRELVKHRPSSLADLTNISGIGQRKLELYGEQIMDLLKAHTQ